MAAEKIEGGDCCAGLVDTRAQVRELKDSDDKQWAAINALQKGYLPVWAATAGTLMGGAIGFLTAHAKF